MKKLLTIEQVAEQTQLSPKSIRMRIWRGEFPCVRINKRVLIPEDQLEIFLSGLPGASAQEAAAKIASRAA